MKKNVQTVKENKRQAGFNRAKGLYLKNCLGDSSCGDLI